MFLIFVLLAAVGVFIIAAVTIGRETHRLDAITPVPTVEINDAVGWISEELPEDVSAQLSYEDVRDILVWHVSEMQEAGVNEGEGVNGETVVVDDNWSVNAIAHRALAEGRVFPNEHIQAVLDAELAYFTAIGAVGPEAANLPTEPGAHHENADSKTAEDSK
jgi:hypothetical protein